MVYSDAAEYSDGKMHENKEKRGIQVACPLDKVNALVILGWADRWCGVE